jgi:hypothetical protein
MGERIDNKPNENRSTRLYEDTRNALTDPAIPKIVKRALDTLLEVHPRYLNEAQKNSSLSQQHQPPDYTKEKHLAEEMCELSTQVSHYVQSRSGRNRNFDLVEAASGYEQAVLAAQTRLGRMSN